MRSAMKPTAQSVRTKIATATRIRATSPASWPVVICLAARRNDRVAALVGPDLCGFPAGEIGLSAGAAVERCATDREHCTVRCHDPGPAVRACTFGGHLDRDRRAEHRLHLLGRL